MKNDAYFERLVREWEHLVRIINWYYEQLLTWYLNQRERRRCNG